jgi:hypothetical protein
MQHIISTPEIRFKCCKGTDEEEEMAEQALRESENLVLDTTALSTIFLLKACDLITKLPCQLVVSEGTIDGFRELLRTYGNPKSMRGSYSKNGFVSWDTKVLEETYEVLNE